MKEELEFPHDWHRVAKCKHVRIAPDVQVRQKDNIAFYNGLSICGSVWGCMICAAKIQRQRREEIQQAITWAKANDFKVIMVTLTHPHYSFQSFDELLANKKKALKKLREGNTWTLFKKRIGFDSLIRSFETGLGSNGWHHHTHELWFISPNADIKHVKEFTLKSWKKACDSLDMIPRGKRRAFDKHAVDIKEECDDIEDYLAKMDDESNWTLADEMAKSISKTSGKITHPFMLLNMASKGHQEAAERFVEYLRGIHGVAQIFWSNGLKKRSGVKVESDQEIVEKEKDDSTRTCSFEHFTWKFICEVEAKGYVLSMIEEGGFESIDKWLRKHGYSTW